MVRAGGGWGPAKEWVSAMQGMHGSKHAAAGCQPALLPYRTAR